VITLIFFLVVAVALLALLLVLDPRTEGAEGSARALLQARDALHTLQLDLLALNLVQNIFSPNDWKYVSANAPVEIQNLFMEERRKIALDWVGEIRLQLICLQHFHRRHARHFVNLKISTELALAFDFALLRLQCRALALLLRLRGPYATPYIAGKTIAAAIRVCAISGQSFAFLAPATSPIADHSAGNGAAA